MYNFELCAMLARKKCLLPKHKKSFRIFHPDSWIWNVCCFFFDSFHVYSHVVPWIADTEIILVSLQFLLIVKNTIILGRNINFTEIFCIFERLYFSCHCHTDSYMLWLTFKLKCYPDSILSKKKVSDLKSCTLTYFLTIIWIRNILLWNRYYLCSCVYQFFSSPDRKTRAERFWKIKAGLNRKISWETSLAMST